MPMTDEEMKIMCCAATCLVVTLLITGWALDSFSKSCVNIDSSCTDGSDQKKQLQTAGSGVIAAAAGIALISLLVVVVTNWDKISGIKLFGFGKSLNNGFGSDDFGGDNSAFD